MNIYKILGVSSTLVLGALFFVSVPSVYAYTSPNILVGQDLTLGSTGQNVVMLQGLMSELGYLNVPKGVPFGYYGTLTKNAVSNYQSSRNVSPSVGYYGPMTKSSMHSDFSSHGWLSLLGW